MGDEKEEINEISNTLSTPRATHCLHMGGVLLTDCKPITLFYSYKGEIDLWGCPDPPLMID